MSNHLFSPKRNTNLDSTNPSHQQEEYLIEDIPLQLRVRTDKIRIPLHKFQNLQVGSLFPLPKSWLSEVIVSINSKDVFLGTYGESGEEKAVQLTKYISDQKKLFP
jgi:flagellar motor switch protein FliM